LVTVYGHVSEILVEPFTLIAPGQIIAKSGGQVGTSGAGIMTSGPHLHFEAHLNGNSVDPLRFLDISTLRYESLPSRYKYKFIRDLRLRYGERINVEKYETFKILGETEMERQEYLLDKYAALPFKNPDIWREEAVNASIDPSFLMCVGLAETGLGRKLKTQFNI
jgi:hypothetical protein